MAAQPTPPKGQTSAFEERRRHRRFSPLARIELNGGGEVSSLPIVDISAGGIRVEMRPGDLERLEIDERVTVFVTAEGSGGPAYVAVPASVVRIQRGERSFVALEWGERSPEVTERLTHVLGVLESTSA